MPGGGVYDRETIRSIFNDGTTGVYRNGQAAGAITEGDHRDQVAFMIDGLMSREDFAPIAVSGTNTYTASVYAYTLGNETIYSGVLLMKFTNANTGAATLQISSTGLGGTAYAIKKNVSEALIAGDISAGEVLLLAFDGTNYQIIGRRSNGVPLYSEITIPTASVLTANATPIELIAAPGAGKAIVLMETVMSIDFNSAAYATNTNVLIRRNTSTIFTVGGFLNASADAVNYQPGVAGAAALNQNINFQVDAGNPTAGNSDVKIKVWYRIIDVTA